MIYKLSLKFYFLLILLTPLLSGAQTDYVPLVAIEGFTSESISSADFGEYLNGLFYFGLAIAAILAVVMIIYGGVLYMGSESVFSKGQGREKIVGAILGLILALMTILIFNQINPDIVASTARLGITPANVDKQKEVGSGEARDVDGDGIPDYVQRGIATDSLDFEPVAEEGGVFDSPGRSTWYGYSNDETPDSNSSAGIGSFSYTLVGQENGNPTGTDTLGRPIVLLKPGDIAVSRDVENNFRSAGIQPGDQVRLRTGDGRTVTTRWMDRTATAYKGKNLTGRYDFYSPGGPQGDFNIVGFEKIQ